ncbi:MAG: molecular chaperone HtpG [Anaerolineae bacterium]
MEQHEFRAEIQQLLNILVHSLYTDREIFVRELLSNATDALHRIKFEMLTERDVLDPDVELAIHVTIDREARTLTVSDTGIGMTCNELIENLGTIAQSGAAAFIKRMQELGEQERPPVEMIGQFGVGFYSAFMAAEQVQVISRSYRPDAEACQWVSDGSASFEVGPAERKERGTSVIVHLTEDADEFLNEWQLEQVIKRHSDFVPFPIRLGDKVVNRQRPLWRQSPQETSQEDYAEFYKHLTRDVDPPLLYTHMVADVPVDVHSILYIPPHRDRMLLSLSGDYGLRLYAKGVMIQERNKDLLPNHFRFVEGVLESEDLPLNVSRETVQRNPAVRRIQKALVGKLTRELVDLAENDAAKYAEFWNEFGVFIKEGVAIDFAGRDDLMPLLRFHSSRSIQQDDDLISLQTYVERMTEGQSAIYYLTGEDLSSIRRSPHLDYFRAHDIEVLLLADPVDSFLAMSLTQYDDKPLRSIDDADLELPEESGEHAPDEETAENDLGQLVARMMEVLGESVSQVRESRLLRDSPCRLVSPAGSAGSDAQRVRRLLNQEFEISPKILEINRRHPLIRNLAAALAQRPEDPAIDATIEQLYENQLLLEGLHPNPATMVDRIQLLMEAATANRSGSSKQA